MFEPRSNPRVFGVSPGVDFPRALVAGLMAQFSDRPPEALARVQLIVNTRRMARRLRDLFDAGPTLLLPKVRLITDLDTLDPSIALPPAASPLRRRLELISLVAGLLDSDPRLAPRASLYDLADSLAGLIDEMQGEGVSADGITSLDVSDQSGHWLRTQKFVAIAQQYLDQTDGAPDAEARQRLLVEALAEKWRETPPSDPVIIAGSTGSRGTTLLLMQAVAALPQGALILPGFDFDMPQGVWSDLNNPLLSEDHPQFRFHKLMRLLGLGRDDITPWHDTAPPSQPRNALVSLSLRPAPFTDAWLSEGALLSNIGPATEGMTLLQADTPRREALAIAMRLRQAAETGQTAALITPDRMLTRQVTSALDRWDILPDDSAGTPLHLSPPGRFLRHVAGLFVRRLDAEALLTFLKHPLFHSGVDRNRHLLNTQRLEMQIRKNGLPYPDAAGVELLSIKSVSNKEDIDQISTWSAWVGAHLTDKMTPDERPLTDWVRAHMDLAATLSAGVGADGSGGLWDKKAGQEAFRIMTELEEQAAFGSDMSASDYADLMGALLSQGEVRDRDAPHPGIMIWGTLEARVQGADLVILGGLNDGSWPEAPAPDPWLNRSMRHDAGLLLPERRIGLSAHDYQQSVGANEVWLTRSIRSDDAETVPSRWLNRLSNLLGGLKTQNGPDALLAMIARGDHWLKKVSALEHVTRTDPATRPAPRPPVYARPNELSVTQIKTLIRDPYAIYARHVLKLRKLGALVQSPDAPMRGIVIHEIMEKFVRASVAFPESLHKDALLETAFDVLSEDVPWPAMRAMWRAQIVRVADWFIAGEIARRKTAQPIAFEKQARGKLVFRDIGFTLNGMADRIDRQANGEILIYDYKTGRPPSKKEQTQFDKQLLIEAAMVEEGAFADVGPAVVKAATFIGLGASPIEIAAPILDETPSAVLRDLHRLISQYQRFDQGYTSRRMMQQDAFPGDYDHLARFGEWDGTDIAVPEDLT
ncbi:MAG: double-strand break repair protein AddB [Sulfitobacter sp.]